MASGCWVVVWCGDVSVGVGVEDELVVGEVVGEVVDVSELIVELVVGEVLGGELCTGVLDVDDVEPPAVGVVVLGSMVGKTKSRATIPRFLSSWWIKW